MESGPGGHGSMGARRHLRRPNRRRFRRVQKAEHESKEESRFACAQAPVCDGPSSDETSFS
ncbi:hypothetical protein ACP70R_041889 [Stipagrostis hirtigluma subsp. patula]